jgi:hypothetical protein
LKEKGLGEHAARIRKIQQIKVAKPQRKSMLEESGLSDRVILKRDVGEWAVSNADSED